MPPRAVPPVDVHRGSLFLLLHLLEVRSLERIDAVQGQTRLELEAREIVIRICGDAIDDEPCDAMV